MPTISELLQSVVALHRGGQLDQARQIYQQVLAQDPRHASALNLSSLLARLQGDFPQALEFARRAVASDRTQAAHFANLGEAQRELGQTADAIESYRQSARLQPGAPEPHYFLGMLL